MATRSHIGILNENGDFEFVYCHRDGYLAYNGAKLLDKFQTLEQVQELIAKGDFTSLEDSIEDIEYFNDLNSAKLSMPIKEYYKTQMGYGIEFIYIFNQSNKTWYVIDTYKRLKKYKQTKDYKFVCPDDFNPLAWKLKAEVTKEEKKRLRKEKTMESYKEISRDEALEMKTFGIYVVSSDELMLDLESTLRD